MCESEQQPAPPRKKQSIKRRVLFSTIAVVAFVGLLVVCDRFVGFLSPPQTASLLFPSDSEVRHESSEFDVTVAISSAGIRDQEYTPGPPPVSTYRIVTVGDSFTFGWGVNAEDAWPNVLEQELDAESKVEVLNFGFPGASPFDYEATARKALEHFQPQMLIVGTLQGDDLIQLSENQRQEQPLGKLVTQTLFPTLRRLVRGKVKREPMTSYRETFLQSAQYARSQFSFEENMRYEEIDPTVRGAFENGMLNPSLVQRAIKKPGQFALPCGADAIDVEQPLNDALKTLQSACESYNCTLIVAVVPDGPYVSTVSGQGMARVGYEITPQLLTATTPDATVSKACVKLGIPIFIQTKSFRDAAKTTELYFPLDGHFNEEGHKLFAENIVGFVEQHMNEPAK